LIDRQPAGCRSFFVKKLNQSTFLWYYLTDFFFPEFFMTSSLVDADFQTKVLKSPVPVLVDFWAPWCGPCKAMNPVIEELSSEFDGKVAFYKVNVDENSATPGQYNVMSIPTFILFKNGEAVDTFIGSRPKEDVTARLNSLLK
jgi:thioredoxin 1